MHRISPAFKQRYKVFVQHAYDKTPVTAVFLLLHFHVDLAL